MSIISNICIETSCFSGLEVPARERTLQIETFFKSAQISVEIRREIDGWLKYHIALVLPLCAAADDFLEHGKEVKAILKKAGFKTKNIDALSVYLY